MCHLLRGLATTENFDGAAAGGNKSRDETPQLHAGEFVLIRMRQHRGAAAALNPAYDLGKIRPIGFDIADFALTKIAVKRGVVISDMPLLNHPCGKMGSPQLAAVRLLQRTVKRTLKPAFLLQTLGDQLTPFSPRSIHHSHGLSHRRVLTIHPQANDVDRNAGPAAGQFDARHELQARRSQLRGIAHRKVAIQRVMIGDRQHFDAVGHRSGEQLMRAERPIGSARMGVEVNQHNLYTLGSAATGNTRTLPGQPNDYGTSRSPIESMKQLLEFIPIVLFFVIYKMDGDVITIGQWSHEVDGIFSATAALMIATVFQVLLVYLLTREIEKRLIWLSLAVLGFGALTLVLRDGLFIQWKPTIFNWGMALAFGASQFIGEKNLMERLLGSQLPLPKPVWTKLNLMWITNFFIVGSLNLVVAYGFSEEAWVSYKLYSAIGFTLLLTILTALVVSPYLKEEEAPERPIPQDD